MMPRCMSFALTTDAVRLRQKTVTRRLGWAWLKPGDLFTAVEKCRGLKKGQKVKRIAVLRCVSNEWVELSTITQADVVKEGFQGLSPEAFVRHFCLQMRCEPGQVVNRIEFEYVEE